MAKSKIYKTTVNLPEESIQALEEIASRRGTSLSAVIRSAIATEKYFSDAKKSGAKILIEEKDKSMKQVIFQ